MSELNQTSEATESVSTPPTESTGAVATETQTSESDVSSPFESQDGWANFGKTEEKAETEEEGKENPEAAAEVTTETEKPKEESDTTLSEEDALLEEMFSDEELDALDPQEVIEAQGSRRKKAAAKRNFELAEIVKEYTAADKPITEVMERFESLAPERFKELKETAAHSLVDTNPDGTFQRAFVVKMKSLDPSFDWKAKPLPTLDDFIAFTKGEGQPAASTNVAQPAELSAAIAELDKTLGFDWRDPANDENFIDERELALVQSVRALETEHKNASTTKTEQEQRIEELTKKLEGLETGLKSETDTKLQTETMQIVNDYRNSVQAKLVPLIAKNTGLEVTDKDTPEIRSFKERRLQLYTGTPYEQANGEASRFELFAYNESAVKEEISIITDRIVNANVAEAQAKARGDAAAAKAAKAKADAERIPLMEMFAKANKEFKEIYVKPDLDLLEKFGSHLSNHINTAAQRVEIPNGSADSSSRASRPDYETADDVWSGMLTEVQRDKQLRAA